VEVLTEAADVNSMYEEALLNLKNRKTAFPKQNIAVSNAEKELIARDYYANVRTNVSCHFIEKTD
jgi:chitin synthase